MSDLKAKEYKLFEEIKRFSEDGNEYWYARELALTAIVDHFAEVSKTITMPKTAEL